MPHFAIRILQNLERMKEKGEITQPEINYWIYNAESKVDRPVALSGD